MKIDNLQRTWSRGAKAHYEASARGIDECEISAMRRILTEHNLLAGKIIDVGAGTGQFVRMLLTQQSRFQLEAFDVSPEEVAMLSKLQQECNDVRFERTFTASFYDNGQENNQYDLATANFCFNCAKDLSGALSETSRILKPGGSILFSSVGVEKEMRAEDRPEVKAFLKLKVNGREIRKPVGGYWYGGEEISSIIDKNDLETIEYVKFPITTLPYYIPNKRCYKELGLKPEDVFTYVMLVKKGGANQT